MSTQKRKPVIIEIEETAPPKVKKAAVQAAKPPKIPLSPATAPPVPDIGISAASSVETGLRIAAKPSGILARVFWAALVSLITFALGVMAWDFAAEMIARNVWLGRAVLALLAMIGAVLAFVAVREMATLARLRRIDGLRAQAAALDTGASLADVHRFEAALLRLYRDRADLRWASLELADNRSETLDVDAATARLETTLIAPLDGQALTVIEAASRQVATATAIVPLALVDVIVALTANLRMIRHIAQIYGGRSGTLGSWRLTKAVAAHLVATGAVAIGDDLIGSVAGGGVLSKISRRFGEGLINGALTARVGIAAMEVCRPMPFDAAPKPRVTQVIKRALTGLFSN